MTFAVTENGRKVIGMDDYIKRDALRDALYDADAITMNGVKILNQFPSSDVEPVKHGQWETNSDRPDSLICSICKCGFDMWKHDPHNYCPNCGAKMAEKEVERN